jgi:hypothetical protein
MKIYVGNLPYEVTEAELRQEFGTFGEVASVNIITGDPGDSGLLKWQQCLKVKPQLLASTGKQ